MKVVKNVTAVIYPDSMIGIIGGDANSKLLALAAKKLGFRVGILTDTLDSPAAGVADVTEMGALNSVTNLQKLAQFCDVMTYQYENIDTNVLEQLNAVNFPQGTDILSITQDRQLEKVFFESHNLNIAPYATIVDINDIYDAVGSIGYPCVLKPIQKSYGKQFQHIIYGEGDIAACEEYLTSGTYILESWVPYESELTIMVAKDSDKNLAYMPVVEDVIIDQKLFETIVPARIKPAVMAEVQRIAELIGQTLDYVGVFGVEFFLTASDTLYVKRLVPGPHTAGNIFNEATNVSQYELHLRTLCHWPLPKIELVSPAVSVTIPKRLITDTFTQVLIKPDWYFYYYLDNAQEADDRAGHVTILTSDTRATLEQIYDTEIWNKPPQHKQIN
ncbi:ATP-grasp domain-containing protein [Loigolactobacillus jiayinensis]|uniref:ATP-grasp domain-containing protein n=1 Tax=Loigolactobacillus jiayinensis TaxID=2486016 RepID=UPI001CDCD64F|nr:ATP-grasp domain-containing protein [Loigolactobacillus jiayinensis]